MELWQIESVHEGFNWALLVVTFLTNMLFRMLTSFRSLNSVWTETNCGKLSAYETVQLFFLRVSEKKEKLKPADGKLLDEIQLN